MPDRSTASRGPRHILRSGRVAWSVAAVTTAFAAAIALPAYLRPVRPSSPPAFRVSILPAGNEIPTGVNPIALSPDGQQLALASAGMLWIRRLDAIEARPLSGTEGAQAPFWSPDGRLVAFFSAGKLERSPCLVARASRSAMRRPFLPGAWNVEDVILFAGVSGGPGGGVPKPNPIRRVSASGGAPEAVTTPDTAKGEPWHLWPSFLPDGRHFVYFASGFRDPKAIYVGSLDSEDRTLLVQECKCDLCRRTVALSPRNNAARSGVRYETARARRRGGDYRRSRAGRWLVWSDRDVFSVARCAAVSNG